MSREVRPDSNLTMLRPKVSEEQLTKGFLAAMTRQVELDKLTVKRYTSRCHLSSAKKLSPPRKSRCNDVDVSFVIYVSASILLAFEMLRS